MEIRREFMLRGVFPQQLPELQIGVEAVCFNRSLSGLKGFFRHIEQVLSMES